MSEPKDVKAYKMGAKLFRQGKTLEALKYFKYAAETGEDRPMEHFALASAYMQVGDLFGARKEYVRFLSMNPNLPKQEAAAKRTLQSIQRKLGAVVDEAPEEAQQGPAESSPAPKPEQRSVSSEAVDSRPEPTREEPEPEDDSKERLEAIQKQYEEALNYYRAGGYDGALTRLEDVATRWGRTPEVLNLMGLCFLQLDRHGEALKILDEAHGEDPENADVLLNLARARFETGTLQARELLEKGRKLYPRNSGMWFNLGIAHLAAGEFESAAECWERVLEIDPNDELARANLEMVRGRNG